MLNDKDIRGVIDAVKEEISHWLVAGTSGTRGTGADVLASRLADAGVEVPVERFASIRDAWAAACKMATENDKIVVFGSFLTVAAVMNERQRRM